MDEDIKLYADSLYGDALLRSVQTLQESQREYLSERTSRRQSIFPLGEEDVQAVTAIYTSHIERCVMGRLESYEQAYREAGRVPSEQDFIVILSALTVCSTALLLDPLDEPKAFVNSQTLGNVPFVATATAMGDRSAYVEDRALRRLDIWKARAQLKPAAEKAEERKKGLDVLLPVFNRAEFDLDFAALAPRGNEASPLSLVFIDLDKFKSINDGPGGHPAGDRTLMALAELLLRTTAGKGSVYRVGGDEFCALLPNHTLREALLVAERILREARASKAEALPDGLSVSVGVACLPESTDDHSKLYSMADSSMYVSKKAGGNRISTVPPSGLEPVGADQEAQVPSTVRANSEIIALNGAKDAEIAALNERISQLSRKPYAEALTRMVKQLLDDQMTLEGRQVLHHLMIHEPVEVGRTLVQGIPVERQHKQLKIALDSGVVRHQEEGQGPRRYYWIINPRFRPVLEDLLYEAGRL